MKTAILVPVLARPHRVSPLLDSIREATPEPHEVYFIPDPGDEAELAAIRGADAQIVCEVRGNYAEKINQAARLTTEPLVFLAADDLHFHPGWLSRAQQRLSATVGVVGTNDLCNARTMAGDHSTHTLVARWYMALGTIDEPGKILHEGYPHEWVDDELVETAKSRGAYAHAADAIVEHLHPMVGKAPMDDLYAGQRRRMRRGRVLFNERRPLWT